MNDKPPLQRFLVRKGTKDFMVWDRDTRGPAKLRNDMLAIGLALEEAVRLRDQLAENAPPTRYNKTDPL
jgi:hypothetical protein